LKPGLFLLTAALTLPAYFENIQPISIFIVEFFMKFAFSSVRICLLWFLIGFIPGAGLCELAQEKVVLKDVNLSLIQSIRFQNNIHFCDTQSPLDNPEIRERMEKEMLLSLWDQPQVILWIKRASRYLPHVEEILKTHSLPLDLKYVPVVESALRAHASSSKSAEGYWQFIESTGRRYGLRIDSHVDERKNIFKSTRAACLYLKDLNQRFGSYLLALAAYNMGETGLENEMREQDNRNFFELYLPLETQRYIFKLISVKLIVENQARYGFYLDHSDLYPLFAFDKINLKTDLKIPILLIAKAAEIPFKTVKDMNPEIRGYSLEPGEISLLVPKGKTTGFKERFEALYDQWGKEYQTRIHIVQPGESLLGIARKYNISLSSLLKLNNLSINGVIRPGDRLAIR
jgi:hypothetical protein